MSILVCGINSHYVCVYLCGWYGVGSCTVSSSQFFLCWYSVTLLVLGYTMLLPVMSIYVSFIMLSVLRYFPFLICC